MSLFTCLVCWVGDVLLSTLVPELHYDAQHNIDNTTEVYKTCFIMRPIQRTYSHAKLLLALPSAWPIDAQTPF